jgi:DNA-binding transcriptional ArsR family regulator
LTKITAKLILNYVVKYRTLDGTFGALADPTRRGIIMRLAKGEASVSELAKPYGISMPAISKHLRVLEEAGLIFRWKVGRIHYCRLAKLPLNEIDSWLSRFRDSNHKVL